MSLYIFLKAVHKWSSHSSILVEKFFWDLLSGFDGWGEKYKPKGEIMIKSWSYDIGFESKTKIYSYTINPWDKNYFYFTDVFFIYIF